MWKKTRKTSAISSQSEETEKNREKKCARSIKNDWYHYISFEISYSCVQMEQRASYKYKRSPILWIVGQVVKHSVKRFMWCQAYFFQTKLNDRRTDLWKLGKTDELFFEDKIMQQRLKTSNTTKKISKFSKKFALMLKKSMLTGLSNY